MARTVIAAGADALIVHARKAWLAGLSPKENRDVPPLDYDRVYRLKRAWPDLEHHRINGGIDSLEAAAAHLAHVDGVMLGRAAYQEPWRLSPVDSDIFGVAPPFASPKEAALRSFLTSSANAQPVHGCMRSPDTRSGLFHGVPGARAYRRFLATEGVKPGANANDIRSGARSRRRGRGSRWKARLHSRSPVSIMLYG